MAADSFATRAYVASDINYSRRAELRTHQALHRFAIYAPKWRD
jgi:hypothetical protein